MSEIKIPYSAENEKAVIACMLMDDEAYTIGINSLSEDSFYNTQYRTIFKAILESKTRDMVIVNEYLSRNSSAWFPVLKEISFSLATSIHIREYIKVLSEMEYRRKSIVLANKIKDKALNGSVEDITALMDEQKNNFMKSDGMVPISESLEKALSDVCDRIAQNKMFSGLRTGFTKLDIMTGGLQKGDLIVVAGRPSMGKTAFVLDIMKNSVKELKADNKIGVLFSLEMTSEQLSLRLYSSSLHVRNEHFKSGKLIQEDFNRIEKYSKSFLDVVKPLYSNANMVTSLQDIHMQCHEIKHKTGKDIGIIAIDYLQLMETQSDNRNIEFSKITRGLKMMAKSFDCPVVVLSQLSRAPEQRADHQPILSDLRESGSIEQDADLVLLLYRDEYYNSDSDQKGLADVIIAKQRNGATGTISLRFDKEYTSFANIESPKGE